jgi:O-antigen ligase
MLNKEAIKSKILMLCIMVVMSIQSAMTFSRGGLYGAAGACIVAMLFLAKSPREVSRILLLGLLLLALGKFVIVPSLDKFTHGALSERFQETDLTGRGDLAGADIRIFLDNPILGVGPGMAEDYRKIILTTGGAAHTEFTRLISEHGLFGITALLLLIIAGVRTTLGAKPPLAKAIRASLIVWSCLYMTNAAMRLAAPSFIWGLAYATYMQGSRPSLKHLRYVLSSKLKMLGQPVKLSAARAVE